MKVSVDAAVKPEFAPINLNIVIESATELKVLRALYGYNASVASVLLGANYMEGVDHSEASQILTKTFECLDPIAEERFSK